jgi:hypothetical protein
MKANYFKQNIADDDDFLLKMAKGQGYVPQGCLLGGQIVMALINSGDNPCKGCNCNKQKCKGR